MTIPVWAIGALSILVTVVIGLTGWLLKQTWESLRDDVADMGRRIDRHASYHSGRINTVEQRIVRLQETSHAMDTRIVRVETKINNGAR